MACLWASYKNKQRRFAYVLGSGFSLWCAFFFHDPVLGRRKERELGETKTNEEQQSTYESESHRQLEHGEKTKAVQCINATPNKLLQIVAAQ